MFPRIALAIVLTVAPAVFAQTYIVPDGDCDQVTFHATRDGDFPNLGQTIDPGSVATAYLFLPKQRVVAKPVVSGSSLDFKAKVGAGDAVVMAAIDFAPVVSGNETRTEHAKAFVYCSTKTPAADWQRSTGLGVEIIPQWNGIVQHLKPGDFMEFIAIEQAKKTTLLKDAPMELYRAGFGRIPGSVRAQNLGMKFPFPGPGRYMVKVTYRRPDPQLAEHWLVDTSTATFEIK